MSERNIEKELKYVKNFSVDWSIGASTINYLTARNRVPQVADQLARLLNFLVTNGSTQMNRVVVAGHSLGAHIAGETLNDFESFVTSFIFFQG